ncbi:hypothetical protein P8452_71919 [Trifolium repens]|nr:hypothetical protein P8452_71919 [Trifolium repens]
MAKLLMLLSVICLTLFVCCLASSWRDSQYLCSYGIDRDLVTSSSASPFSYANCRTIPVAGKRATRVRNIGHITQIANKLIHLAHNQSHILSHLQRFNENMRDVGFGREPHVIIVMLALVLFVHRYLNETSQ